MRPGIIIVLSLKRCALPLYFYVLALYSMPYMKF